MIKEHVNFLSNILSLRIVVESVSKYLENINKTWLLPEPLCFLA